MSKALLEACLTGNLDQVKEEIEINGANPNFEAPIGTLASRFGSFDSRFAYGKENKITITPLVTVILGTKSLEVLTYLLENGADVNSLMVQEETSSAHNGMATNRVVHYKNALDLLVERTKNYQEFSLLLISLLKYKINLLHFNNGKKCLDACLDIHSFSASEKNYCASTILVACLAQENADVFLGWNWRQQLYLIFKLGYLQPIVKSYVPFFGRKGFMPYIRAFFEKIQNDKLEKLGDSVIASILNSFEEAETKVVDLIEYTGIPKKLKNIIMCPSEQALETLIARFAYQIGQRPTPATIAELNNPSFKAEAEEYLSDPDEKASLAYTETLSFLKSFLGDPDDIREVIISISVAAKKTDFDLFGSLAEIASHPLLKNTLEFKQIIKILVGVRRLTQSQKEAVALRLQAEEAASSTAVESFGEEVRSMSAIFAQIQSTLQSINNRYQASNEVPPRPVSVTTVSLLKKRGHEEVSVQEVAHPSDAAAISDTNEEKQAKSGVST